MVSPWAFDYAKRLTERLTEDTLMRGKNVDIKNKLLPLMDNCSHCQEEWHKKFNLSVKRLTSFKIFAVQFRFVTETAPTSSFFCVNNMVFNTGARAIRQCIQYNEDTSSIAINFVL